MKRFLTSIILISIQFILYGQTQKVYPKNAVINDTSLVNFIGKLTNAIKNKDDEFLISSVDNDVYLFAGASGKSEFIKKWEPKNNKSNIWIYLPKLISLGGYFAKETADTSVFVFSYIDTVKINVERKTNGFYIDGIITDKDVPIYEAPSFNSKVLDTLSYDVVSIEIEPPYDADLPIFNLSNYSKEWKTEWIMISTMDETIKGYVFWDKIWSQYSLLLTLEKRKGIWKIIGLDGQMF